MKLRYARHTDDIERLVSFYTDIIGLQILDSFQDHSEYNGVFLGLEGSDWHIEFTKSNDKANHIPDDDDLLVLYLESEKELQDKLRKAEKAGINVVKSKNPYWRSNGIEFKDPDGFGVILVKKSD
jgi:catechol-2,3-dioxygenase